MKYIVFTLFFINVAFSQNATIHIYSTADVKVKPVFARGEKALQKFILANFVKPKVKILKGEVLVSFVVEVDGSLSEIGVLQDVGYGTGDEAIRVMELSPNWIPGRKNGTAVRTQFLLPIKIN